MITTRRKIAIYLLVFIMTGLITFIVIYQFVFLAKKTKGIVDLGGGEQSWWAVENFDNAELKFFPNDTFHIKIVNSKAEQDYIFIGIGKYEKTRKQYKLTFLEAFGNGGYENIADKMNNEINNPKNNQGQRSGLNKVRFVDHNGQIYYFA
jgi:hypothetical protein